MYGKCSRSNYTYKEVWCNQSQSWWVRATPTPARVQPTVGNARISPAAKPQPKPRMQPRPTSGRHMPKVNPGNRPQRRVKVAKPTSSAQLHAAWAKGKDIC